MNEDFIRERLTALRLQKNISEYRLSFDLGHSKGYIQNISAGRAMPSMSEFLYICEYFGITPSQFFEESNQYPTVINETVDLLKAMKPDDIALIHSIAQRLSDK